MVYLDTRTTLVGVIFQNASYTITVPCYLIMHVLTSPLAQPSVTQDAVALTRPEDAGMLIASIIFGFVIPTIVIALPSPVILSSATHYDAIALWQGWPLWQGLLQFGLGRVFVSRPGVTGKAAQKTLRSAAAMVYTCTLALTVGSHLPLLLMALTPASAVPSSWPAWMVEAVGAVDVWNVFVPQAPWDPPRLAEGLAHPFPTDALAPLARYMLQFDCYGGNWAILVWAVYLCATARSPGVLRLKSLVWFVAGGPVALAAVLLWERDQMLGNKGHKDE
jgi:hypothetical protein